jgi:hypothetical protein
VIFFQEEKEEEQKLLDVKKSLTPSNDNAIIPEEAFPEDLEAKVNKDEKLPIFEPGDSNNLLLERLFEMKKANEMKVNEKKELRDEAYKKED